MHLTWTCLVLVASAKLDTLHKVNPVEKVTALLEKLQGETEAEGKAEAVAYDKYACFCKDNASNKQYAIEKFQALERSLNGKIEDKSARKAALDQAKMEHDTEIASLETEQSSAQTIRDDEFATYSAKAKELSTSIKNTEGAVDKMKAAEGDMVDASASYALITKYAPFVRASIVASIMTKTELLQNDPHAYASQSGEIMGTLMDLVKEFKEQKITLDDDEMTSRHEHEMIAGARQNKIDNLKKSSQEKAQASNALAEELSEHQTELQETQAARTADQSFLEDLTAKCEHKAQTFDQRSSTRSSELQAIAKAIELLKGDVSKMYTLSLTQKPVAKKDGHWEWVTDAALPKTEAKKVEAAPEKKAVPVRKVEMDDAVEEDDDDEEDEPITFLQVRPTHGFRTRLLDLLAKKAEEIKSPNLSTLLIKLRDAPSPMAKVKQMILDLVARLEKEAADEADQKGWCDTEMAETEASRDAAQLALEGLNSELTEKNALVDNLTEHIATMSQEIADLQKGLNDETTVRNEEKAAHDQALADAQAGLIAVSGALDFLNDFYNPSFIQKSAEPAEGYERFAAEGAGSDGQTVGDLAPDAGGVEGTYSGNQGASKSIIGLLDVIKSDFENTISSTQTEEAAAVSAYEQFKSDSETSMDDKNTLKETSANTKSNTENDITQAKGDERSEKEALQQALDELEKLKPVCVDSGASWEEKTARRKQEIEALKEAKAIFENTKMPNP